MKTRILAALIATLTAVGGLVTTSAPAGAATPPTLSLSSAPLGVHTSNDKAWHLGVYFFSSGSKKSTLSENMNRGIKHGSEEHDWQVQIPTSSLKFNTTTQRGTLTTPGSDSSLTTVNMAFKASSHKTVKCASGSETFYTGTLSGHLTLITGLKGGGTVGGKNVTVKSSHLTVDRSCQTPFPTSNVCFKSMYYSVDTASNHSIFGDVSGKFRSLEVSHGVSLKKPANAQRQDGVSSTNPTASLNLKTKTLRVSGASGSPITGSGRLTGGTINKQTSSCRLGKAKHTEVTYNNFSAHWVNGGTPLIGHSSLTGKLTLPNSSGADYSMSTWH